MKKILILLIVLLHLLNSHAQLIDITAHSPNNKSVTWYEKIHIHTDRSIYFSGDTIWYKAYLIDCNHKKDTLSNILYVDFTNDEGKIIKRQKLRIEDGMAHGDIAIDSSLVQGKYAINAFTSWMLNYSKDHSFKKTFDVYSRNRNLNIEINPTLYPIRDGDSIKVNFQVNDINNWRQFNESHEGKVEYTIHISPDRQGVGEAKINDDGSGLFGFNLNDSLNLDQIRLTLKVDNGAHVEEQFFVIPLKNKPSLRFYPEGGELIDGISTVLGFKGLETSGKSFEFAGILINSKSDTITKFQSNHLGMGSIAFTPKLSEKYKAYIYHDGHEYSYPLPAIKQQGYLLNVSTNQQRIELTIHHNFESKNQINFLIFKQRHKIIKIYQIKNPGFLKLQFPLDNFPNGLISLTLADEEFTPLSERLFFADKKERLNITLKEPVEKNHLAGVKHLEIEVDDLLDQPTVSNFSVSICETNLKNKNDDQILSRVLLSSEIKGNIEDPGYYFRNDEVDLVNLDYLLLTQGWRNYLWTNENINTSDTIAYKIERGFVIDGKVHHRRKNKNIEGYQLHLMAQGDSAYFKTHVVDKGHQFSFDLPWFYGNQLIYLQGKSKGDRRQDIRFFVNEPQLPDLHDSIGFKQKIAKTSILNNLRTIKKAENIQKMVEAARHVDIDEVVVTAKNLLPWYHERPEASYELDSLDPKGDRYPNLFSFLEEEYGAFILKDTADGSFYDKLMMPATGSASFYEPIFLLDGMVILDAGEDTEMYHALLFMLTSTPMNQLKTINVYEPGNYSAHYASTEILHEKGVWQSLVELESYNRNFYRGNPLGVNVFNLQGLFKPHVFYQPPFDALTKEHIPDTRSTVYWNPNVRVDKNGKTTIKINHFNHQRELIISVEGMNEEGTLYGAKVVPLNDYLSY